MIAAGPEECFGNAEVRAGAGDTAGAIEQLQHAVGLDPGNADYFHALGGLHKAAGDWASAERCYRRATELEPAHADAWVGLGLLERAAGRAQESEQCQRRALDIDPDNVAALVNLGNLRLDAGAADDAAGLYRRALAIRPGLAQANNNLGRALGALGQHQEAVLHLRRALAANPGYFEAWLNLGKALHALGGYVEAIEALQRALAFNARSLEAVVSLADAQLAVRLLPEAQAGYERALQMEPDHGHARLNLALVHWFTGRITRARQAFEEALRRTPDEPTLRFTYGCILLREAEFERGWDYYEARQRLTDYPSMAQRDLVRPRWTGEPLAGRGLLVAGEQGLGDEIMFASMLPELRAQADHVVLECHPRLEALFRRSFPACDVVPLERLADESAEAFAARLASLPVVDCWSPAGSLARHLRRSRAAFPAHRGYLRCDPAKLARWRERLKALGTGPKLGLSWIGGTLKTNALARSLPLDLLLKAFGGAGAHFVSLQYTPCAEQIASATAASGIAVHHWQEAIDDLDEMAALVCALDLVVSVCTMVAHLGGALGRPVWVLAPHLPEWRYGRTGERLPWYPSVRMFRQPRPDAWAPVLEEVAAALRAHLASPGTHERGS
jgi:tetratricopeptide (TPR) repeat protein